MPGLPEISQLRTCDEQTQTAALDNLFEPSPAIHSTLLPIIQSAEYTSYPTLIDACHTRLKEFTTSSSTADFTLLSILASHPRLGEKKITSAHSQAEQASLQQGEEAEELDWLNTMYDRRFPGLRYVVFVNGRERGVVMEDMRARIERGDFGMEVDAAVQAMCDIAKDRASKM